MLMVQARVSIAVKNHHDKNKLGRKEFIWLIFPYHCSPLKEVRTGTHTEQEPGDRSGCRGRFLACSFSKG